MAKYDQIMKVLAILGGLIALIVGLLDLLGFNYGLGPSWGVAYLFPIIAIILGIVVLLSAFKGNPVPFTAVWLLVLGILILIFGSWIAAVLVIIAGIIGFLS